MARIVVEESFDPPLTAEIHAHLTSQLKPCLELRDATWISSHMSTDRTRCICIYEAKDAQAVRDAYQRAGFKYDRVWASSDWAPA
jgi:ribosomal protein L11 methylase PrmA